MRHRPRALPGLSRPLPGQRARRCRCEWCVTPLAGRDLLPIRPLDRWRLSGRVCVKISQGDVGARNQRPHDVRICQHFAVNDVSGRK